MRMRRRECNQKKEGGGVLGVIGRKVGGKMRGSKRRKGGGGEERRRMGEGDRRGRRMGG